jgi:hypothetical protein
MAARNTAVFGIYPSEEEAKEPPPELRPAASLAARGASWPASAHSQSPDWAPHRCRSNMAALWTGVGGAVGGLVGALVGLGIPEYEAKRYETSGTSRNWKR